MATASSPAAAKAGAGAGGGKDDDLADLVRRLVDVLARYADRLPFESIARFALGSVISCRMLMPFLLTIWLSRCLGLASVQVLNSGALIGKTCQNCICCLGWVLFCSLVRLYYCRFPCICCTSRCVNLSPCMACWIYAW
ncbi:hypothetical protein PR202_ga18946 [Eleusine coracana subsp. coracana]|uniref:Uncharacterized protein n=1 Tax=Eleusine coracana subsp. coracana TaxID=191504 RepID=A0AAV5CUH0_ELECO|nr:hypothetical protein PR202_ga18946 [Eleusine coracana subsp. coracana]